MIIRETTADTYAATIQRHPHIYNTPQFASLNAWKADNVVYLLFEDNGKTRFGMILGERGGKLMSPFSSPFGGFSSNHEQSLKKVEEAVEALSLYAKEKRKDIRIVLPPQIYDDSVFANNQCFAYTVNVLSRHAKLKCIDLNYFFQLSKFANYDTCIERNARKNLRHALASDLEFVAIDRNDTEGKMRAYNVISLNRKERGFPLRMTWEDVEKTTHLIPADFFLVRHEGSDIAAAQVFNVAPGIAQVIYWGDLRAYSAMRPMNFLSYHLFKHYSTLGLSILDIGISTEDGVPNYGLCEFKTSIGCDTAPKFIFEISGTY